MSKYSFLLNIPYSIKNNNYESFFGLELFQLFIVQISKLMSYFFLTSYLNIFITIMWK